MTSRMYQLPLYFPPDTNAAPADRMYRLDNYHGSDVTAPAESDIFNPAFALEKDQLQLIKRLEHFNAVLDKHLSAMKSGVKSGTDHLPAAQPSSAVANGNSKDKKKAKGDAAKVTAQKKGSTPASGRTSLPWKVVEEKSGAEENNGIVACASPSIVLFPVHKVTKLLLSVTEDDLVWVTQLAQVGGKRDFRFDGIVTNGARADNGTVTVEKKDVVSVSGVEGSVSGRVPSVKLIAAALGLFSFEAERAVQAAHVHRWLLRLDEVVQGKRAAEDVDVLVREMSQFLSRFDSLSTQPQFSVADILIRPLLSTRTLPNNVELWAKRLDPLLL